MSKSIKTTSKKKNKHKKPHNDSNPKSETSHQYINLTDDSIIQDNTLTTLPIEADPTNPSRRRSTDYTSALTFNNLEIIDNQDHKQEESPQELINTETETDKILVSCGCSVKMRRLTFFLICLLIAIINIICFAVQYYFVHNYLYNIS